MSSVLGGRKSQRGPSSVNTVVESWLRFFFCQKLTHKHRCVSWCANMMQNLWLVVPQFYAFLTNCFALSAYNFKVVLFIDPTTLWQEFIMAWCHCIQREQWAKPLHLCELDVLFSVLAPLYTTIGRMGLWFQCHSHTPMIRRQLWPFWINLDCRWTSSTSSELCPCHVVFAQIFAAARFMPKTSVKIAWHEPIDMPSSSATSLIMIRQLFKIIFFTASMFPLVVDVLWLPGLA